MMTDHQSAPRPRFWRCAVVATILATWSGASYAAVYPIPDGQNLVGDVQIYIARKSDVLLDVARTYDLGYTQLVAANPTVDPWLPGEGTRVVLPTSYLLPDVPRKGIVINLAAQRLYYFLSKADEVETFPIGVGVQGWITPLGETRVTAKEANPAWYPPKSIRAAEPGLPSVVRPGPDNPLGGYALHLGWPGYLIHGTNKPYGVGRTVSHGCIRLYPEDIAILFLQVPAGTPVRVIDEEAVLGWVDGELYLEVHPNKAQTDQLDVDDRFDPAPVPGLVPRISRIAGAQVGRVDWAAVRRAERERTGIPSRITLAPATAKVALRGLLGNDSTRPGTASQGMIGSHEPSDVSGEVHEDSLVGRARRP